MRNEKIYVTKQVVQNVITMSKTRRYKLRSATEKVKTQQLIIQYDAISLTFEGSVFNKKNFTNKKLISIC